MALLDGDASRAAFARVCTRPTPATFLRRLTKEELRTFDGRPLFPERRAYTVNYQLSADEAALYDAVTEYVREEMNRADRLAESDQRRPNVGFALQIAAASSRLIAGREPPILVPPSRAPGAAAR